MSTTGPSEAAAKVETVVLADAIVLQRATVVQNLPRPHKQLLGCQHSSLFLDFCLDLGNHIVRKDIQSDAFTKRAA